MHIRKIWILCLANNNASDEKNGDNLQDNVPIVLETKKSRKINKKKKRDKVLNINVIDEETEDNSLCCITDGVRPLREGESAILELSFG